MPDGCEENHGGPGGAGGQSPEVSAGHGATMIPTVIHQTWKSAEVPGRWSASARSWSRHHPAWSHRLWSDAAARTLIARCLPRHLASYDALPYGISRADFIRYAVIYLHGGVYTDLDIECLRAQDALCRQHDLVLVEEPASQARRLGVARLLSNAWFAACPGHPFVRALLDEAARCGPDAVTHMDVLSSTGPLMVQRVFERGASVAAEVLPADAFFRYPAGSRGLELLAGGGAVAHRLRRRLREQGAFGIHYWSNSWVGELSGALVNPRPHAVPGFVFIQGLDSPGHDVRNGGRDIPRLARDALAHDDVIAFNTDGFMKTRLRTAAEWARMGERGGNEGLYIRADRLTPRALAEARARSAREHPSPVGPRSIRDDTLEEQRHVE